MQVACFCGEVFESDNPLAPCPKCREWAVLPSVTDRDRAEMECDLDLILAPHEPTREPPHGR